MTSTEVSAPSPEGGPATSSPATTPAPPTLTRTTAMIVGLSGVGIGLVLGTVLGLVVIPTIAGLASGVVAAARPSPIAAAIETCEVETNLWISVGDSGDSLSMDSFGEETDGADFDDIFCMLDELDTPDSVIKRINSTRALDGRQNADWDGFSASWGYHPDNGLDIVIDVAHD